MAWLVVAGPPAEEGAQPQDEISEDIVEVPPPVHEEVRTPVTSRWELTSLFRSRVICAGRKGSRVS